MKAKILIILLNVFLGALIFALISLIGKGSNKDIWEFASIGALLGFLEGAASLSIYHNFIEK